MTALLIDQFTEQFPAIVNAMAGTGYELRFDEAGTRVGVGATVLVTVKRESRGFSLCWRLSRQRLEGAGNRSFSASDPTSPASQSFLTEFRRRVALRHPQTLSELAGGLDRWDWKQRRALKARVAVEAF